MPRRRRFRFSLRDLLWLTALAAVALGWGLDHWRLREAHNEDMAAAAFALRRAQQYSYEPNFEALKELIEKQHSAQQDPEALKHERAIDELTRRLLAEQTQKDQ